MKELTYNIRYKVASHNHYGILPKTTGGFYTEFLVLNYTDTPIYIQTALGEEIPIETTFRNDARPRVEIWRRSHVGMRKFKNGGHVEEASDDPVCSMIIDWDKFYNIPTYVKEFNILVYGKEAKGIANHPHLDGCFKDTVELTANHIMESASNPPMAMLANDPSGDIKRLFVEMNEYICEVPVSNDPNFTEEYVLALRDTEGGKAYKYYELDITAIKANQLVEQSVGDYSIFRVCASRTELHDAVIRDRESRNSLFDYSKLNAYRNQLKEEFSGKIEHLKCTIQGKDENIKMMEDNHKNQLLKRDNEIDILSRRLESLQKDYEIKLGIRKTDMELKKYDLDATKCDIDKETAELNHITKKEVAEIQSQIANLKVEKEKESNRGAKISTISTTAKAAAVMAPIVVGIGTWMVAKYVAPVAATVAVAATMSSAVASIATELSWVASNVGHSISNACTAIFGWLW